LIYQLEFKLMALKKYNPMTPGQRGLVLIDRTSLFKGKPVKKVNRRFN
jgi:Ribosomal protein L2